MPWRKRRVKKRVNMMRPKKNFFGRPVFWCIALFLTAVSAGAYFLLFYSGFQVQNISVSGNERVKTRDLEILALDASNTGLINFLTLKIASRSMFLLDSGKLGREISDRFPAIEKININKIFPQTLTLMVTERKPVGFFCADEENKNCFLIDKNGVIFEPAEKESSDSMFVVRRLSLQKQVFAGEQVIGENTMAAIYKIEKDLKDNFQIDVRDALVSNPLRLGIKTSENWQIYFNLDSELDLQIARLNLLLKNEISEANRANLQYIDLRFKDRAYYK